MIWKVCLVTFVGLIVLACTKAADSDPTTTTTVATTTTTAKPRVNTKDSALCKKCKCLIDEKLFELDCTNRSMTEWFNAEDWNTLANGDVLFETIRLENNNLTKIPVLNQMPVKNIYLGHNLIEEIADSAFKNLPNLTILDLSYNKITSKALRPAVFQGLFNPTQYDPLVNLKELDLGHNELHSLDSSLFATVPNLEVLILGSNQFHVLDHLTEVAIGGLVKLKTLDLSYMELKDLPDHLLNAPRDLENLILTGNLLDELPDGLELAVNLKRFVFDENPMENMEGENVFGNMSKLEFVSISYSNDLERIGKGAFSNLTALKTLVLASNPKLNYIHPEAFALPTVNPIIFDYPPIEELFLHNNNLTLLDRNLVVRWDKVKTIDLQFNPWECSCNNTWLIHTLMTQVNDTTPQIVKNIACGSPDAWKAIPLMELNEGKTILRCTTDSHPENDGRLLIGLLIGILVGVPMTFGAIILYRRGCFGLFNRGSNGNAALYNRASFQDDFHI